ncbi:MAG: radical SAM protein [Verrucomicrobiae bacterium]|nr:radical SAM protein [Verrucomicrobiae bacterium]
MNNEPLIPAHRDHRRQRHNRLFVYPVISRRARGVSIGINLNPDKVCNFDCVYCEVDRQSKPLIRQVDLTLVENELRKVLAFYRSGDLFKHPPFDSTPAPWRRLNDIAFSGEGEPTSCPVFLEAATLAARIKDEMADASVKIVLITNATLLDRPKVRQALKILDDHQGEIWAKLDAGTEDHYRLVNRSNVKLERILKNIETTALERPIHIQSLFFRLHGQPPDNQEMDAYLGHLQHFLSKGCQIKEVQVYTIARPTPEAYATALPSVELRRLGELIRSKTGIPVQCYAGNAG